MGVRASGVIAVVACVVMVASDLLMLTMLDFTTSRPLWQVLNAISDRQMLWGYYLGEVFLPVYILAAAWHIGLAVRPAGRWATWVVSTAVAYSASLAGVWHATFAFYRILLRAGANEAAEYAFSRYGLHLFVFGLFVLGLAFALVAVLTVSGRTLYPRWAVVVSPLVVMPLVFVVAPRTPGPVGVVLMAAGWNVASLASLVASTGILWNRGRLTRR
jgi:hypothetical protein